MTDHRGPEFDAAATAPLTAIGDPPREGAAGIASQLCPEGYFWLGDLSGWEVSGDSGAGQVALHHRCGYAETLRASGIRADFSVYVGNIVDRVLQLLPTHVCPPHTRSPETAAMVRQWEEAERVSGPPRPLPPEEPADIPVRRQVEGRWQTVMVTLTEWRENEGADGRAPVRVIPPMGGMH